MKHIYISAIAILLLTPQLSFASDHNPMHYTNFTIDEFERIGEILRAEARKAVAAGTATAKEKGLANANPWQLNYQNALNGISYQKPVLKATPGMFTQIAGQIGAQARMAAVTARQTIAQVTAAGTAAYVWAQATGASVLTAAQSGVVIVSVQIAAAVGSGIVVACETFFLQYAGAITDLQNQCDAFARCQSAHNSGKKSCQGSFTLKQLEDKKIKAQEKARVMAESLNACTAIFRIPPFKKPFLIDAIDISRIRCN